MTRILLGGFIAWNVLLPVSGIAQQKNSEAAASKLREPFGIDILPMEALERRNSLSSEKSAEKLAEKLAEIDSRNRQIRSDILQLQSAIAARSHNSTSVEIRLETTSKVPAGNGPEAKKNGDHGPYFRIMAVSMDMNNLPILMHEAPLIAADKSDVLLLSAPLPIGEYQVRMRARVGLAPGGDTNVVPLGLWEVESEATLRVTKEARKTLTARFQLQPRPENRIPELVLLPLEAN